MAIMEENSPEHSAEEPASDSIEAVRDLLFGKRTAEISGRIEDIEHSLRDSIYRMEERVETKLSVLEGLFTDKMDSAEKHISNVENRLKSESETRVQQGEDIRQNLDQAESRLTDKINSLENRLAEFESKIWDELRERTNKNDKTISDLRKEWGNRLESEIKTVGDKSADRTELGDFLIDLGLSIQPGKEGKEKKNKNKRSNEPESSDENEEAELVS